MIKNIHIVVVLMLLMASCANRGQGPQGGPRDTIPPVVVKEDPLNGTLQFHGKEVVVSFDEYIQLSDIQKNVLISPPQQVAPEIKAIGKTVSVVLQEELLDSTTYTIDFGSAICDYNEKTPLEGYVYSFSTGVLDRGMDKPGKYTQENIDAIIALYLKSVYTDSFLFIA